MGYKRGLSYIIQKSSKMFLLAFLVSLTAWILINLSKSYEREVTVNISFKNLEEGTFVKKSDSILKVSIEGTGFSLLSQNTLNSIFEIDIKNVQKQWRWSVNTSDLNRLFSRSITVLNVVPSSVEFEIKKSAKKKVPIQSLIQVKPKLGYGITSYKLAIDSTFIYGDISSIDSISGIKTDSLFFENITESIKGNVSLQYLNRQLKIQHKSVDYFYEIERFTQGDFRVEIKIKNKPKDKEVTIFPKEVHVQFQAPISKFSTYNANQFSVYVDVNDIYESNTLPVYIEYMPKGVTNARVLKKSVTYLLLEK